MSRCCNEKINCNDCPFHKYNWDQIPAIMDIASCVKNPDLPEILIFDNNKNLIREMYRNCLSILRAEYETQNIYELERKHINREKLSADQMEVFNLWNSYSNARCNIPPLEHIAIERDENRDIQAMLYSFFNAVAQILSLNNSNS